MNTSRPISVCQSCGASELQEVLFLGFLPPVNALDEVGSPLIEHPHYPAQLLSCAECQLVQLGCIVDPTVLFPSSYPYTSSTTKILRENFIDLRTELESILDLARNDLVVDVGSNDGNLLSNFTERCRVLGITPEDVGRLAVERGIPTLFQYFDDAAVGVVRREYGLARVVAATNVFAHIDGANEATRRVVEMMTDDGVFVSESHYLGSVINGLQYDTVYHEHLRYYSLTSLRHLLHRNGLEVFHVRLIPTHGGSIRVYAAKKGRRRPSPQVDELLRKERKCLLPRHVLAGFAQRVLRSKLQLLGLLETVLDGTPDPLVFAVGAPSRASTLVSYVGIDQSTVRAVAEIAGSHKIGKRMPGTTIPIVNETEIFSAKPTHLLLLSWHIADELMTKLRQKGYGGKFIIPLPQPRIVG